MDSQEEYRPLLGAVTPPYSGSNAFPKPDITRSPTLSDQGSVTILPLPSNLESTVLPETSPLGRNLGWQSAYILVISRVIGSGIFATPGTIIRAVGSVGLALSVWVIGAAIASCGLLISLEYGCMLPRSGGEKVYLEFTYRRPRFLASTLVAAIVVCLGFTASNCVVFSQYVLFAFGVTNPSDALRKGLAVALLTTVTIIHGCFRKAGVKIQNLLGWLKIALIAFMILSGIYIVVFRPARTAESRSSDIWVDPWRDSNWNWSAVSTALFAVFYSYSGLENSNNVLSEVKDPVRTLRSVSAMALVTACVLYLLTNVAYFLVVPVDEIKSSGELVAALFFERVFGPQVGGKILPLAIAVSTAGNVMVVSFALARIKHEIARQGFLPFSRALSSTKPFNSPLGAFVVHYIPSFLVIVLPPSKEVYAFILQVEGYPAQIMGLGTACGILWLRRSSPRLNRPFKAWIPTVWLRIAMCLALIAAPFFPPSEKPESGLFYATYALVGVGIILLAALYWYVWTVLIPRLRGYRIEEETEILDDGTSITKLVYVSV